MARLQLILLRHGEAEEGQARRDRERVLTKRGLDQATRIGAELAKRGVRPELFLSSDAARAHATAEKVAFALESQRKRGQTPRGSDPIDEVTFTVDARLYLAGLQQLAPILADATATTILCVGHNPGFSTTAAQLTGEWVELSTAEAAHLAVDADDWAEAPQMSGAWELLEVLRP